MIKAEILLDSQKPLGVRLTTFVLTYPRFIHSELMTHRVFSRNSASSRAIPIKKMLEEVKQNPAMPCYWGKNIAGMQAKEELTGNELEKVKKYWLEARDHSVSVVEELQRMGLHKQISNRLLEPWFHMRTILTATEFDNFYALRRHPDAQPEFKELADKMWEAQEISNPEIRYFREWHLPFIRDDERSMPLETLKKISVARCCRVSYLNVDGSNPDVEKDINLYDKLLKSGHMSPFEHVAECQNDKEFYGNFRGWKSLRKFISNEHNFKEVNKKIEF